MEPVRDFHFAWSRGFAGALAFSTLTAAAAPARLDADGTPSVRRLAAKVTLDGTGRTLQKVLDDLKLQLPEARLQVTPRLQEELATVWARDRPASEILRALALAVHGGWKSVPGGLRLEYLDELPADVKALAPEVDLAREASLGDRVTWPPVPVERPGREVPRRAVEGDYNHQSMGAALAAAAREKTIGVAVVSPALRTSASHSAELGVRSRVTGATLFGEMAALEGGRWERVGATYVLCLPPAAVKLRQLPHEELFQSLRDPGERFFSSLTRKQREILRPGGELSGQTLTDPQKALITRFAEIHHAFAPRYSRRLVYDRNGYYVQGLEKSVIFGLGNGERPLSERERPAFEKMLDAADP